LFETLQALPADTILGLIAEYRDDPRPNKIDLGVGVYRNAAGETPVLATIKKAEQRLLQTQTSKSYLGTAGDAAFNTAMQAMIFAGSAADDRLVTLQTPGGSGSLRVAAGLLMRAREDATVWVSEPTWANHVPLLGGAGLTLKAYPYYDTDKHVIHIDEMLETLRAAPKGDVVLLHACCHNPCGLDPSENEWREIAAVVAERELLPFIDIAYQGFASNIDDDAFAVRHMASVLPEMIVSSSCSKNFGLYRDRVGSLSLLSSTADSLAALASQANNYVRTVYSVPPDHGAAVVSIILNDDDLHTEWLAELKDMRDRLIEMRMLLNDALIEKIQDHDFSHLRCAKGMFCFLGISAEQIARLKQDFGIYMVDTSRINVAGITVDNVDYLADSIAAVL